jgi:hypothetical protein
MISYAFIPHHKQMMINCRGQLHLSKITSPGRLYELNTVVVRCEIRQRTNFGVAGDKAIGFEPFIPTTFGSPGIR